MRQKITLFTIILFQFFFSYGQTSYKNSLDEKIFELKQYILKDYKNLKLFYPLVDCFEIAVEIDTDTKMLHAYTLDGYEDTNRVDSLAFWAPFEEEIKRIFHFNPSIEDEDAALFNFSMFRIELNQEVLKNELKAGKMSLNSKCKYMIKPNAKFSFTINELTCKPFMKEDHVDSLPKKTYKSQLRGLKSDVFQINENYFLHFAAAVSTSDESCPCKLEAFIYYVKDDIADLLSNPSVEGSNNPVFKLKERSSWKNEEATEKPEMGFFRVDLDVKFK